MEEARLQPPIPFRRFSGVSAQLRRHRVADPFRQERIRFVGTAAQCSPAPRYFRFPAWVRQRETEDRCGVAALAVFCRFSVGYWGHMSQKGRIRERAAGCAARAPAREQDNR
jgi:hypothetical protein